MTVNGNMATIPTVTSPRVSVKTDATGVTIGLTLGIFLPLFGRVAPKVQKTPSTKRGKSSKA